ENINSKELEEYLNNRTFFEDKIRYDNTLLSTTRSLPHFYLNPETYRQQFRSMETKDILEVVVLQQYLRTLYPEGKIWVQEHRPAMAAEAAELVENYVAAQKSSKTHRYAGQLDYKASVSCFNCAAGHKSLFCPLKKSKYTNLCYVSRPTSPIGAIQNREPVVMVELNGKPVVGLVDTGCAQTLVQAPLAPPRILE
uniref:SCAN box domain-containing protein n=1 Tax=Scleropages formosus TaxID=113540 RepID=A0A8C9STT1_SCLFO